MSGSRAKLIEETKEMEAESSRGQCRRRGEYYQCLRPGAFRAYLVSSELTGDGKTIREIENILHDKKRFLYIYG